MAPFLNYVVGFALGGMVAFLLIKTGPTLKQRNIVKQLKDDKLQLKDDKLQLEKDKSSLQNRNNDLSKTIIEDIKVLKNDVKTLQGEMLQCHEIISSVTGIREQFEITSTQRWKNKYGTTLNKSDKINPSEIYESD